MPTIFLLGEARKIYVCCVFSLVKSFGRLNVTSQICAICPKLLLIALQVQYLQVRQINYYMCAVNILKIRDWHERSINIVLELMRIRVTTFWET